MNKHKYWNRVINMLMEDWSCFKCSYSVIFCITEIWQLSVMYWINWSSVEFVSLSCLLTYIHSDINVKLSKIDTTDLKNTPTHTYEVGLKITTNTDSGNFKMNIYKDISLIMFLLGLQHFRSENNDEWLINIQLK